jgi:hypothetical protein
LGNLAPYGGSTWWAITRSAAQYLLDFTLSHPRLANFFKHTLASDEFLIHIILGNSPYMKNVEKSLTFTDWSAGGKHPAWIGEKHLEVFQSSLSIIHENAYGQGEVLFARKFSAESAEIVDQLDKIIQEKDRLHGKIVHHN